MAGSAQTGVGERSRRAQLQLERRLASVFRALSGDSGVDLWSHRPVDSRGTLPMNAPHLYPTPATASLNSLRGATDAMAMRRCWSDLGEHLTMLPESTEERLIVEILEQQRCESLAHQPGVRRNLALRHADWCGEYLGSRLHETHLGLLLFTVIVVARATLVREPIAPEHSDLIEETRFDLSTELGPFLSRLQNSRHDQTAFAEVALELARMLAGRIADITARERSRSGARQRRARAGVPLVFDVTEELFDQSSASTFGRLQSAASYQVWDTGYDTRSHITELVRAEQLRSGRNEIAAETVRQAVPLAPVVSRLHSVVESVRVVRELVDAEEGVLDPSRLTRLVTSPGDTRVFRGLSERADPDCAVTFLLDLSGSMKVNALGLGALLDVVLTALDRLDVRTEVLGFTTNSWSGGRARRDWKRAGSPEHPGRLNEVHHIVVKSADTAWRRSRTHLGGLLKTSLYREGIDAEALRWAAQRVRGQRSAKSAIVVISDGMPADSATAEANDEYYLARDLQGTVSALRKSADIGVLGIGVGSDPSPIYSTGIEIDPDQVGDRTSVRAVVDGLRTVLRP